MIGIDRELSELAGWIEAGLGELVEAVDERQREQVPGYLDGAAPIVDACGREATASILQAIAAGLTSGREAPAHLPPGAVHQAAVAAAEGVPWATVARTHTIAHAVVWERLIAELEQRDLDGDRRAAVLQVLSRFLFGLVDHITTELSGVYAGERERLVRDSERRKTALVRDLLAGLPVAPDQLAYELRSEHLGAIAWGADPEAAATSLAAAGDLRLLTVDGPGDVVWAWLGGQPTIGARALRALASAAVPADTCVALGEPAAGPAGFRATHLQASEAQRVALHRPQPLTRYDHVALEALALQDTRLAREFAVRELGPLAAAEDRAATLRDTLRAYFITGQNASAAAAMLGVHERTVSYRLASAGERLGRPIAQRRDELALALRVLAVLEPSGAPAGPAFPGAMPSRTTGTVV
ncbi:MAG: PucR family transcriptional regulator [Solirubrobacteraceae bacterium]